MDIEEPKAPFRCEADDRARRKHRHTFNLPGKHYVSLPSRNFPKTKLTCTGHLDPGTRKLSLGKVTRGKRYVMFTRQVEGMPVFSSRAIIGFTSEGRLGFLNVHWPVISEADLKETRELRERVRRGWKAPVVSGARVESVEAGIVHSPSAATVMDIHPVIRVIYTNKDRRLGLRPVRFFNGDGVSIRPPRIFTEALPEKAATSRPKPGSQPKKLP